MELEYFDVQGIEILLPRFSDSLNFELRSKIRTVIFELCCTEVNNLSKISKTLEKFTSLVPSIIVWY